ncbi:MAG: hypothetical protein ACLFUB_08360 [Cyclobacteriaceae bacterium]
MKKDYLYTLLAAVGYICLVGYVTFDVAHKLGEDVVQQRYLVPLSLGFVVFTLMVFYLLKENRKEKTDKGW